MHGSFTAANQFQYQNMMSGMINTQYKAYWANGKKNKKNLNDGSYENPISNKENEIFCL